MKLIQLNAWHWRLYWPLRRFFEAERPDIICAQESIDAARFTPADHYTARGLVGEGLASHYVQSTGTLKEVRGDLERMQNVAILAQQPLALVADPVIPQLVATNNAAPAPAKFGYHRLLHATLDHHGTAINILTYHGRLIVDPSLPHEGRGGTPGTTDDMARIADYIDMLSGPIIFSGDFNLWPSASALLLLTKRLRNLVTMEHMVGGRNQLAWKTDEIVSHMFVSDEIKVKDFRVARDLVSDHQPLILEFDLV